ncbi:DUF4339 domain-containing protein [Rhodoblastus sp.]|uniref:DUF4339 domain-containing protein n=1 Tax=Rhodoblastus sp. TaxID=1962975 RepID=UPI003F967297
MTFNYFYNDRSGARNGPVSFEDLIAAARAGRLAPDCLVWPEGGEAMPAGRIPGLAEAVGGSSLSSAPAARGPLIAAFPGWGLIWRAYVFLIALVSIVFAPVAGRWFWRFVASRVALPNGARLFLDAPLSSCWWLFLALSATAVLPAVFAVAYLGGANGWAIDHEALKALNVQLLPLRLALDLAAVFLAYLIVRWFARSLRAEDGSLNIAFTGGFWAYFGWDLLIGLSAFTIIGWAWAAKGKMRWMCRRTTGSHSFEFVGAGWQILGRTFAAILGPGLLFGFTAAAAARLEKDGSEGAGALLGLIGLVMSIAALAWAVGWLTNWWVSQIVAAPAAASLDKATP